MVVYLCGYYVCAKYSLLKHQYHARFILSALLAADSPMRSIKLPDRVTLFPFLIIRLVISVGIFTARFCAKIVVNAFGFRMCSVRLL